MTALPTTRARNPAVWDPFSAFAEMRRQMDGFMTGVLDQQRTGANHWRPAIDVDEDERGFTIHIAVPGWTEQEVTVEVDQDVLTIRGQRGADDTQATTGGSQASRWSGSFVQSLTLPAGIEAEHISARLARGLLSVHLPKRPQAVPRRIPIGDAAVPAPREPAGG